MAIDYETSRKNCDAIVIKGDADCCAIIGSGALDVQCRFRMFEFTSFARFIHVLCAGDHDRGEPHYFRRLSRNFFPAGLRLAAFFSAAKPHFFLGRRPAANSAAYGSSHNAATEEEGQSQRGVGTLSLSQADRRRLWQGI